MQLRFKTGLTSEEYVSREAWREATLERCPLHPDGDCGFARHGSYARVSPPGARVARWRCPQGHCTFSLLPDCLAARLPGALAEVEAVTLAVEHAPSLEAAADRLRPDIELPGAIRWTRRRVQRVHAALHRVRGVEPERFAGWPQRVSTWRARLGVEPVLPALRAIAADYLHELPTPLGFSNRLPRGGESPFASQHAMGPDPPGSSRYRSAGRRRGSARPRPPPSRPCSRR